MASPKVLVLATLVLGWVFVQLWRFDPHDRWSQWSKKLGEWSSDAFFDDAEAVRRLVPPTDPFLDCAGHGINSALLPDHVQGHFAILSPNGPWCKQWIEGPTRSDERRWIGVDTQLALRDHESDTPLRVDELMRDADGWVLGHSGERFELWVKGGSDEFLEERGIRR